MVTRGRKITKGQHEQQTGPSLFDLEDQADMRRGLVEPVHYMARTMSLACGADFLALTGPGHKPGQRVMTLTKAEATCPECRSLVLS